jgi:hypothetical protein
MSPANLSTVLSVLGLVACSQTDTVSKSVLIGTTPGLLTTADLRTITERPLPYRNRKIVCTEPPPDVAKALSTAFAASASGSGPSGASGSGSLSNATAESLAELTGRVPGLIALRDALFRACEGYANGMIGDSTYSLVTSRYGELLVTLMLAEAVQPRPTSATLVAVPIAAPLPDQSGKTGQASPQGGVAPPAAPTAKPTAAFDRAPVTSVADLLVAPAMGAGSAIENRRGYTQLASLSPMIAQAPQPAAAPAAPGAPAGQPDAAPAAHVAPPAPAPVAGNKPAAVLPAAKPATVAPSTNASNTGASDSAAALPQMQQNYFGLGIVQPLLVACINEFDVTRAAFYERIPMQTNPILSVNLCTRVVTVALKMQSLQTWAMAQAELKKAGVTTSLPLSLIEQ